MPWFLYLALKHLFPTGRRLPFFTTIAVVSVALGVGLLVVVLSVMGGFQDGIRQMTVDTQGDVQVTGAQVISDPDRVQAIIGQVPSVVATTPFAQGVVLLMHQQRPAFPAIQGVDVSRVTNVIPLERYVRRGTLDDLDDDSVILSAKLAIAMGVYLGDRVEVYSPLIVEKQKENEIVLPRELKVVGIFEVGHQQLDSSVAIVTLRLMQELYGLGRTVHGINVKLAPEADAEQAALQIQTVLPAGLHARSWYEINEEFLWIIQLEKNLMTFILLFVVLVAAFLTMSLLLVLVLKKTREIGLLAALGAGRRQIALCFCLQGVGIGIVGTAFGVALGFTFLYFRNDIVWAITRFTGSKEVLSRFYQFSELPAHTDRGDLMLIIVAAVVLSTLAGLVPAIIAARLKPVEALRSE